MARELFQQIDVNGDGTLDRSEIAGLATRLGKSLTEKELTAAMSEMDVRTHRTRAANLRWQSKIVTTAAYVQRIICPRDTSAACWLR